VIIRKWDNKEW